MKAKEMWGAFKLQQKKKQTPEAFWNVTGHNKPAGVERTQEECSVSWPSDSQRGASLRAITSMCCRNVKNVQKDGWEQLDHQTVKTPF